MCAHRLVLLLALGFSGCASQSKEVVFRDPRQIALAYVDEGGERSRLLGPGENTGDAHGLTAAKGSVYRDAQGLPRIEVHADYLWEDGRLITDSEPAADRSLFRLAVPVTELRWCHRPLRRCWRPYGSIEFITSWSNVTSVRRRAKRSP